MALVRIARNAVAAKLVDPERNVASFVSSLLSYEVENAGPWSGKSSFYDVNKNTFPAGFLNVVQSELTKIGHIVQVVQRPNDAPLGPEKPIVDKFGNDDPRYDYQMRALRQVEKHGAGIIRVATGGGKCLGKDTPVLMYDGTIKMAQDVAVGDQLMGPDSTPRRVLSTCSGVDPLYRVTPTKGDSYVVNNAHILSLKKTSRGYRGRNRDGAKYPKGEVVNISVADYLSATKTFRHTHKGWRAAVDFAPAPELPVDPYFVGLLLGDGGIDGTVSLTTADPEMVDVVNEQAEIWGLGVMPYGKTGSENKAKTYYLTAGRTGGKANPLTHALRALGLGSGDKFVPHSYKTASREDRMQVLAGILDTDGYYDGKGFYITLKCERLLDDTIYLARSLGFGAYKKAVKKTCCNNGKTGDYFATVISGDIDQIPVRLERRKAAPRLQKKDTLVCGLTVEPIGEGEYFGFEIDGDSLFMLGDFTVTHNSKVAKLIMARYRRMTLFVTTRGILLYQMRDQLDEIGLNSGIIGDSQMKIVRGVNLGMVQTLVQTLEKPHLDIETRAVLKSMFGNKKNNPDDYTDEQIRKLAKDRYDQKVKKREAILKFLAMVEVVIGEEAHEAGGTSYYEILRHCKNATIRVALTATPFMRSSAEDNMRLMAAFGPVLIDVPEELLIERGILAKPYFKFANVEPSKLLRKSSPYERALKLGYTENPHMYAAIIEDCRMAAHFKLPALLLVSRKTHGDLLNKALAESGLRYKFLRGEDDMENRKEQLRRLSCGEIDGVIGTNILDVGVDVPSVGFVGLCGGGKAEVSLRQRVGRGLRAKKTGANIVFVADYSCNLNNYLRDHQNQRRRIIERTPGFAEGILPGGQDFDWKLFDQ